MKITKIGVEYETTSKTHLQNEARSKVNEMANRKAVELLREKPTRIHDLRKIDAWLRSIETENR
jgi:hypothetical protein